jgi:hypothetical protein
MSQTTETTEIIGTPEAAPPRRPIAGPFAWRGAELGDDWIRPLPAGAPDEIDAALRAVKARGLSWPEITRAHFPLPQFAATLAEVSRELEHGRGFVRLRGLPAARYDEEDLRKIFWGIGTHLGTARYQNADGELIGEVRDEVRAFGQVREVFKPDPSLDFPRSSRSKARSSGPLRFHTDRCDVTALLCARPAKLGGISKVVSAVSIHNQILARRPDLLEVLYGDYYRCRVGEEKGGEVKAYALPVFALERGHFTTQYSRTFVETAPSVPGVPPLSARQVAALDLLHEVGEELCVQAHFEPGDVQFLNNHVVYHARSAYEDDEAGPGEDRGRLLLRLWLSMPNSRPLPKGHEVLWGAIEAGALRGGIAQPG